LALKDADSRLARSRPESRQAESTPVKPSWIERIERELQEGRWCALATAIEVQGTEISRPGEKLLLLADGTILGDLGSPELALRLVAAFQRGRGVSCFYEMLLPLQESAPGQVRVYLEVFAPPPEVLIIGGGHVGKCVAELAGYVGLPVLVADDRAAFANAQRFPLARQCFVGELPELLPTLPTHPASYVVICTRGHGYDELAVGVMLRKPHAYVGLLGSKRKAVEIARGLHRQGLSQAELDGVHTPIGLPIGAETPEEIAVSIVAEILSLARSKERYRVQRIVG
jgi:xanthine dehydrogenase accessory factor